MYIFGFVQIYEKDLFFTAILAIPSDYNSYFTHVIGLIPIFNFMLPDMISFFIFQFTCFLLLVKGINQFSENFMKEGKFVLTQDSLTIQMELAKSRLFISVLILLIQSYTTRLVPFNYHLIYSLGNKKIKRIKSSN
jgi:hypothetical protein